MLRIFRRDAPVSENIAICPYQAKQQMLLLTRVLIDGADGCIHGEVLETLQIGTGE